MTILRPRLSVRFLQSYQFTHDGIDLLSFTPMTQGIIHSTGEPITCEYRRNHDRLQRSNYLTFGGGVAFALNESLGLLVEISRIAWGENVHPLRAITAGLQERAEHTALAWSADRNRSAVGPDGDGAEHTEFHKEQP